MGQPLVLAAPGARLEVSPLAGGRIASLVVRDRELLVTEGYGPIMWGCYPMAPWAGRVRDARVRFGARDHRLRANEPPHALHGTVFDRPWTVTGPDALAIDLGEEWPFAGRVSQRFALTPSSMTVAMTLEADEPMPVVVGWHPWFRRRLAAPGGAGEPSAAVQLAFAPGAMYERDAGGLPTGRLVDPSPPPWDDCFRDLAAPPVLTWPGVLALRIESDLDHVVVYSRPEHALCVEPQSGPPDGPNLRPRVVAPGTPLTAWMTFRWWTPGGAAPQPRSGTTSGGTSQRSTPRP